MSINKRRGRIKELKQELLGDKRNSFEGRNPLPTAVFPSGRDHFHPLVMRKEGETRTEVVF